MFSFTQKLACPSKAIETDNYTKDSLCHPTLNTCLENIYTFLLYLVAQHFCYMFCLEGNIYFCMSIFITAFLEVVGHSTFLVFSETERENRTSAFTFNKK